MTTALLQPLVRLRARARAGIVLEAAGTLAMAAAVFVALSFALDRTFRLEVGYRAALLAGLGLAVARIVRRRLLRPLAVQLSDDELALAVERRDLPLQEALISAVQFQRTVAAQPGDAPRGDSRQLMQFVVAQVNERARRIPFAAALDRRRTLGYGAAVLALVLALTSWLALDRATCALWFRRSVLLSAAEWPRRTHLQFLEPVLRLPQGDDLTLRVAAAGAVPEQVRLHYRFASGERGTEPMTLTGDAEFRATLTALLEGVVLHATGGDGVTDELAIEIVERPVIADLQVTVQPPAYVGGTAEATTTEADIRVLRGSKLTLQARSDKPVQEAFLLAGEAQRLPLTVDADGHGVRGELVPEQTGTVIVDVVDRDRLGARSPPRLFVRVQDDQAPAVDLRLRGIGSMVTQVARIPADLVVRDDLGLSAISAWHRITGEPVVPASAGETPAADAAAEQPAASVPEPTAEFTPVAATGLEAFVSGERELRAPIVVDLRDLGSVHPGQMFALRFDAADNFGPGPPHLTQSDPAVFRVVTAEELATDLQRRQLEQRKLLEALLVQLQGIRVQLDETISPEAGDARAAPARQKLGQLAKTTRDLGARTGTIGQSYGQILDEALNNRIAVAADLRTMRERVVDALARLSADDFPGAASATDAYAAAGKDDLKQVALATYDTLIGKVKGILMHMQQEERLAAVVAHLRELLKLWGANTDEVTRRRGEAGSEVFGPDRDGKGKVPPNSKDGDHK